MIRFKCMYCGEKLKAKDSFFGKKVHCPKCGHVIRATNANVIKEKAERPKYMRKKVSTATDDFRKDRWTERDNEQMSFFKRMLIPQFDELTLFLMSVITIILVVTNGELRLSILSLASFAEVCPEIVLMFAITVLCGVPLSIYHVFTRREKSYGEKMTLVGFAVLITAASGICAGRHMLKESVGWELIFPLWNIVNAVFMIVLFRLEFIDEDCIADKDASMRQVLLGVGILLVVFVFCQYVFDLYWAVTMSVCVAYSTNFTLTSDCEAESDDEEEW